MTVAKNSTDWFAVDKDGLEKLLSKPRAVLELLQNGLDQNVTHVDIRIERTKPNSPYVRITVADDDPEGFVSLSHAFTLFAESVKKGDPTKRGRFNLGEKLVLACCTEATITTTTGTVTFDAAGRTVNTRRTRSIGSEFSGVMRMTTDEMQEALRLLRRCLPSVPVFVNGEEIPAREPVHAWVQTLQTEIADATGFMRKAQRMTNVRAYAVEDGEVGTLYELGIPVVETGDLWHVSVQQKVPLTLDRSNVPPAYLTAVRVGLFNALGASLTTKEEATATWVREAAAHPDADAQVLNRVLDLRFTAQRASFDPSDPEANKLSMMQGVQVVPGGSLSAGEWENARKHHLILPAGQVTPSPKPFRADGSTLQLVTAPTEAMTRFVHWAQRIARALCLTSADGDEDVTIVLADDPDWGFNGAYGSRKLTVNVANFGGARFFCDGPTIPLLRFLIHEYAHEEVSDHLSSAYHEECCRLGALGMFAMVEDGSLLDKETP